MVCNYSKGSKYTYFEVCTYRQWLHAVRTAASMCYAHELHVPGVAIGACRRYSNEYIVRTQEVRTVLLAGSAMVGAVGTYSSSSFFFVNIRTYMSCRYMQWVRTVVSSR